MGYMAWTWCKVRVCCGMRYYIMSCAVLGWVREGRTTTTSILVCCGGVSERRGRQRRRRDAIIRGCSKFGEGWGGRTGLHV